MKEKNQKKPLVAAETPPRVWLVSGIAALVAVLVYACTFSDYLFPSESAGLFAQWTGLSALAFPEHPVWGRLVAFLGGGTVTPVVANVFSLACGVFSAVLLCWLVSFFIYNCVRQEDAIKVRSSTALLAGGATAFAFVFSVPVWHSSTHLEYRIFDVAFALAVFACFVPMARNPRRMTLWAALAGVASGIGLVESVVFLPLLPVFLLATVSVAMRAHKRFFVPLATFFLCYVITWLIVGGIVDGAFLDTPGAVAANYDSTGKVLSEAMRRYVHEMRQWFTRPGWLCIQLFATLPFIACAFAAGRGLNNERTWSQYAFHFAMTVCSIFALATPLAPEALLRAYGIEPVATTALAAAVCGYLAAYWWMLARSELSARDEQGRSVAQNAESKLGKKLAPAVLVVYGGIVVLSCLVNGFSCSGQRGAFADACADEIVQRLGSRTWFVTDGTLDDHLRAAAAKRGKELNLVCLHRDMDDAYLKEFAKLVKEKKLSAGHSDLSLSISLGILPFIQDWFAGDTNVCNEAAVFGVPDIWYVGERMPVSECMFFGGTRNVKGAVDGKKAKADFLAFWDKIEKWLPYDAKAKGSYSIGKVDDPIVRFRLQLRRHVGFVANNLGVMLQDLGLDDDAFAIYDLVLKTIDPDNVSALFNEFEMARAKVKVAADRRVEIEKKLRAIVEDTKRRYVLWSLSRYYGYIRNPEIFARMGFAWARSGQTGNAIAQVQRAIDFIPAERQAGLLNMMAELYAGSHDKKRSRETYEKVLAGDASNHDALIGLTRLYLASGEVDAAKKYLTKAVKAAGNKETSSFDNAFLSLMNNDLTGARVALQKVTDLQPKSLQAWSLLAGVLLQQADQAETDKNESARKKALDELENSILPKMEAVAESPRDYFLQVTRALVLMRKGDESTKQARDCLALAMLERPDVSATAELLLNLDIKLDDAEAAERHARLVLRRDRQDRLANYVMGSLRLRNGEYSNAETFLRRSVESDDKPLPASLNDLAETLRRLQRYDESEVFARRCVKAAPDLYVAWETLGSVLLDQNKNLDEAEENVKKAIHLSKDKNGIDDLRMQITLARVQLARGDLGRARGTIRSLKNRESELSNYDRNEVEKLIRASNQKKR